MTSPTLVGYARVSTDAQDLTAQRDALAALGVPARLIYSDKGMTGPTGSAPASERRWRRAARATHSW